METYKNDLDLEAYGRAILKEKLYPNIKNYVGYYEITDKNLQMLDKDVFLLLSDSRSISISEKVRKCSYKDILLEFIKNSTARVIASSFDRNELDSMDFDDAVRYGIIYKGWGTDSQADIIVYYVVDDDTAYMLYNDVVDGKIRRIHKFVNDSISQNRNAIFSTMKYFDGQTNSGNRLINLGEYGNVTFVSSHNRKGYMNEYNTYSLCYPIDTLIKFGVLRRVYTNVCGNGHMDCVSYKQNESGIYVPQCNVATINR